MCFDWGWFSSGSILPDTCWHRWVIPFFSSSCSPLTRSQLKELVWFIFFTLGSFWMYASQTCRPSLPSSVGTCSSWIAGGTQVQLCTTQRPKCNKWSFRLLVDFHSWVFNHITLGSYMVRRCLDRRQKWGIGLNWLQLTQYSVSLFDLVAAWVWLIAVIGWGLGICLRRKLLSGFQSAPVCSLLLFKDSMQRLPQTKFWFTEPHLCHNACTPSHSGLSKKLCKSCGHEVCMKFRSFKEYLC